jgi:hypothetical protein
MQTFVGVNMIEAEPMSQNKFNEIMGRVNGTEDAEGYMVSYPDGYKSWSPRDVFEASYFPLEKVDSISQADVDLFMGEVKVQKIDHKTTLVSSESITGFSQYETSSCVDPANYDEEIGASIASKRIKDNYWRFLGFVLQWAKFGLKNK